MPSGMSEYPPGPGHGWVDPYGNQQPGSPPPGYWQASDGRWYPPDSISGAQTQVVQPVQGAPGPGYQQPGGYQEPGYPSGYQDPSGYQGAGYQDPSGYQGAGYQEPGYPGDYQQPGPGGFQPPSPGPPPIGPYGGPGQVPGPGGYGAPAPSSSSSGGGGKVLLLLALGAVAVIGLGALALFVARSGGDDDSVAANEGGNTETTVADGSDEPGASGDAATGDSGDATSDAAGDGSDTTAVDASGNAGGGPDGANGCTILDEDTLEIDFVNTTSGPQTFFLTVAFLEGDQRLGDSSVTVSNLRPGERAVERSFIFDQEGSRCEIIDVDGFGTTTDADHLADVGTCQITGADFAGDVTGELTVTNSSPSNADYSIEVAFIDPDGVRRGTGFTFIEAVRPGEAAPGDLFSFVEFRDDLTCEIIDVIRTPNDG